MEKINDKKIDVQGCIEKLVENYHSFKSKTGIDLILLALSNPGKKIPLKSYYSKEVLTSESMQNEIVSNLSNYSINQSPDCPIEMSDYQTVKEVRARANYLIEMIADFENQKANGDLSEKALYRENEARVELQGCQKYLDEVTTIHNKIRYFTHSESKMEKAAKEAVRRAIDELKGRYPNEAALIESGITIRGMWMELR